ncbi:hypothetical protein [Loktanella sp. Alg231-35]|uniref:hypothetical protein n=1 Tax=Loktanella sp. Alg231-35 TaxID=1922220 RepID=UPI001F195CE8|nr:hypothetical protein [Loktanella sp. Alg231-35]
MRQEARISDLIAEAAQARTKAIFEGTQQQFEITEPLCSGSPQVLTYFADGSAAEIQICLAGEEDFYWLHLDPLTGLLTRMDAP